VLGGYWILLITTESGLLNISESENCQFQTLKKNQNQRPPVISKPLKEQVYSFHERSGKGPAVINVVRYLIFVQFL
jgi:hypothetical protein